MEQPKLKDKFFEMSVVGEMKGPFEVTRIGKKTFRLTNGTSYMIQSGTIIQGGTVAHSTEKALPVTKELAARKERSDVFDKMMNSKTNLIAVLQATEFLHLSSERMAEFSEMLRDFRSKTLDIYSK